MVLQKTGLDSYSHLVVCKKKNYINREAERSVSARALGQCWPRTGVFPPALVGGAGLLSRHLGAIHCLPVPSSASSAVGSGAMCSLVYPAPAGKRRPVSARQGPISVPAVLTQSPGPRVHFTWGNRFAVRQSAEVTPLCAGRGWRSAESWSLLGCRLSGPCCLTGFYDGSSEDGPSSGE